MKFNYQIGDVTKVKGSENAKIWVFHVVNDEPGGTMGSGVAAALAKRWPKVKTSYHQWARDTAKEIVKTGTCKSPFKLGRIQPLAFPDDGVNIVNMIAQSDCGGYKGFTPIRYQSLEECLMRVKNLIQQVNRPSDQVICPMFGSKLAGGNWFFITEIVTRVFKDMDIQWTWYCLTAEEKEDAETHDWNNSRTAPAVWTNAEA